jgi:hypothetical protein
MPSLWFVCDGRTFEVQAASESLVIRIAPSVVALQVDVSVVSRTVKCAMHVPLAESYVFPCRSQFMILLTCTSVYDLAVLVDVLIDCGIDVPART